jgi:hypothetical protein
LEGGLGFVMTLLRTMKGKLNCFVQSVSGVVVLRIGTKDESDGFDSDLRMSRGVESGVNVTDVYRPVHGVSSRTKPCLKALVRIHVVSVP